MVASKQTWRVKKDGKRATTQRKSCDTCHKSKTRCDRQRPICSTCSIFARTCTYMQRDQYGALEPPKSEQSSSTPGPATITLQERSCGGTSPKLFHLVSYGTDPKRSALPPLSISSTTFSEPESLFATSIDRIHRFADEVLPTASIEQPYPYDWSPSAPCHQCRQLQSPYSNRVDPAVFGQSDHASRPLAQGLIEAMALQSDRESSAILAAIRMGIPWATIHDALLSPEYHVSGLARVLEPQQTVSHSESHRQPDDILVISSQQVWNQLQHESILAVQDEQSHELIGTMKHARRKVKAANPPLYRETSTVTEAGKDIHLPKWAILPIRIEVRTADSFDEALDMIQAEVVADTDLDAYCGSHAYLGALLRPKHSQDAPRLSQIIAELLRTLRPESVPSVTSLGMMWLYWCVFSWMLSPTKENFERMPKFMRPTPWQICQPHILVYDFITSAALRDHVCKSPPATTAWIAEALKTIICTWPKTTLHALCRHPATEAIDLHRDCKAHASRAQNWSLGPSVRPHLPNVDEYITIQSTAS